MIPNIWKLIDQCKIYRIFCIIFHDDIFLIVQIHLCNALFLHFACEVIAMHMEKRSHFNEASVKKVFLCAIHGKNNINDHIIYIFSLCMTHFDFFFLFFISYTHMKGPSFMCDSVTVYVFFVVVVSFYNFCPAQIITHS